MCVYVSVGAIIDWWVLNPWMDLAISLVDPTNISIHLIFFIMPNSPESHLSISCLEGRSLIASIKGVDVEEEGEGCLTSLFPLAEPSNPTLKIIIIIANLY